MGITEYARHRGLDHKSIRHALLVGRIQKTASGQIDSDQADRDWQQWHEEERVCLTKPGQAIGTVRTKAEAGGGAVVTEAVPGITYLQARALSQVWDAKKRKLLVEKLEDKFVDKNSVAVEAARLYRSLRDACFELPARLATPLSVETDPTRIYKSLETEIRQVFQRFSEGKLG